VARDAPRPRGQLGLLGAAVLASLGSCTPTGSETPVEPSLAALTQRLQDELDRLHESAQATDEVFPGATVAFVLPDGRAVVVATGDSDVEEEIPMTTGMLMPAGSIGKTFVAALALSLAQDGRLDLDDRVARWLGDEDWYPGLPNRDDITLRMLLNHSSGLVDHVFETEEFHAAVRAAVAAGDPDHYFTPRELIELVLDRDPLFPAGQGFNYTDTGYLVAGLVLEKASGMTFYQALQERILDPLQLTSTLPQDRRSVPGLAQGYAVESSRLFGLPEKMVDGGRLVFHPRTEWTGGGLFSNSSDLARWAKTLYQEEALPRPYLDELLGSVAEFERDDRTPAYGLGVFIREGDLGRTYGHGGFFPGYNSRMLFYPQHGLAAAMQINTDQSRVVEHLGTLAGVVVETLPH
jgi:D-alanyl-D-alanine carboxypeptidase